MADLQFLNPQYKLGIIPATGNFGNVIRLPKKFIPQFQKREQEIYAYKSAKTIEREALFARLETLHAGSGRRNKESGAEGKTQKFHIVEQGESLGSIARMYRTYISQLIAWNSLKDSDVTPGQKLIVFGGSDKSISSQANVSKRRSKNMRGSRRLKKEVILQRKYIAQSQAQSQLLPQHQPQSPQPQAKEIVAERLAKTVERDELFAFVESHKDLNAVTSVPAAKPIQNAVTSVPAAKPIQNAVTSVPAAKPIQNAVTSVTAAKPIQNAVTSVPAAKPIQNAVTSIPPADPDSEGQVYITHVVVEGENLSSIAAKYGTTVSQLIAWNTLKDSQVTPGQKLIVFVNDGNGVSSQAVSGKGDVSKPVQ